jgi:hypothetical protein
MQWKRVLPRKFLFVIFLIIPFLSNSQNFLEQSKVSGNFEADVQTYQPDVDLGITDSTINGEKIGLNGFGNVIYTLGDFTAGLRFETYLKPIAGYNKEYEGLGIPYWFANYRKYNLEVTLGNVYDQFGSGLVFRSYEQWDLGYDNAVQGLGLKYTPSKGILLKGIIGSQRYFWIKYKPGDRGYVRGLDAEFNLNDMFTEWQGHKTRIILGGSAVSKYQKDDPTFKFKLPENVAAFAGRFNVTRGKYNLQGEYAYKINDPSAFNNYIFKNGQALFLTGSYSTKGLGISLFTKWIDNMSYKTDRRVTENGLDISFIPPLTKQHNYTLEAIYPYASQPNGEFDVMAQVTYTIPKKSKLGGKYGTTISLLFSQANSIQKDMLNDTILIGTRGTLGYKSPFFKPGDELYFQDMDFEITRKITDKFKVNFEYMYHSYDQEVMEGHGGMVYTHIAVADMTYKFTPTKSLRMELQYLGTKQDKGDWGLALLEYTIAPKWFFTVQDQFNFNRPDGGDPVHYYYGALGFTHETNRISLAYGRQREGLLCVGGVCRQVPAASGFMLTITSSF